jgi:hypothetical protein
LPTCLLTACLSVCLREIIDICRINNCARVLILQIHDFRIGELQLQNCDCGSASFKFQNCDYGPTKNLRMPTSDQAFSSHEKIKRLSV